MIPLFKDDATSQLSLGTRLRIDYDPSGYNLYLNNPATSPYPAYEVSRVESLGNIPSIREERPAGDGSISSTPRKASRVLRMTGFIRANKYSTLYDYAETFARTFDPVRIAHENTDPYLPLDFSVPTDDTVNWATGLIPCRYYALAMGTLDVPTSSATGKSIPFTIDFFLKDPRRYAQTASTVTGTGTAANKGDYRTYPIITITATGAGSASYSVANTTAGITMALTLSGLVNNDVVVVDMDKQTVTKNGVSASSLISGTPGWFYIAPGNNTITVTNGTNVTTSTSLRSAWCD